MHLIVGGQPYPRVWAIQKQIHEYSGIYPEEYMNYMNSMDTALTTMDPTYLYTALEQLRNIPLTLPRGDTSIPEEIDRLADQLGQETEYYIMKHALKNGIRFNPRYLNNIFVDTNRRWEHHELVQDVK